MKTCTKCSIEKSLSDFHKSKAESDGLRSWCKSCACAASKQFGKDNKNYRKAKNAEWKLLHPTYSAEWYKKNESARKILHAIWRKNNKTRITIKNCEWKKTNAHKVKEYGENRREAQSVATPKWATMFFIKEAYRLAKIRTKSLGFKWEVDHIVPILSKRVCGLHVENNIRVIPQLHNCSKNNNWWPDMPEVT